MTGKYEVGGAEIKGDDASDRESNASDKSDLCILVKWQFNIGKRREI